jgi:hypothetical protein
MFNSILISNMEWRQLSRDTKRIIHISSMSILKMTIGVRLDRHSALKWNRRPSNIDSYFHRIVFIKGQNLIHPSSSSCSSSSIQIKIIEF